MCGEQNGRCQTEHCILGSPPHVRGTDADYSDCKSGAGITPACAGNSLFDCIRITNDQDHPRMCGEQIANSKYLYRTLGSPPHVRGTEVKCIIVACIARITPACAGNRASMPS